MPFPKPNISETYSIFTDRCMSDSQMLSDFPEASQRNAVCNSIFSQKYDFVKSMSIVRQKAAFENSIQDVSMSADKELKLKGQFAGFDNRDSDGDVFKPGGGR